MSENSSAALKASVVIPVKNGGQLLIEVLQTVLEQETPWPFEVLVIDSGSRDDSCRQVRMLEKQQIRNTAISLRLHEIPPETFGHGKTRNLGANLTHGEFIVFITQDALPADRQWLMRLVAAAELTADTAGAFGRHLPYPYCNPITARELNIHFPGFGSQPNCVRMDDTERYQHEQGYRQFLHFFSSNNACIRRSVWQQIPLPEVDFAEDQLWAKAIIEAGYAKAYAPDACVYHSHNFGILESYRRAFDESRALKHLFGYDLAPTLWHTLLHTGRFILRDWQWIITDQLSIAKKITWLAKIPMLNAARLSGYYAGSHQTALPAWLSERFSRDKSLQRS